MNTIEAPSSARQGVSTRRVLSVVVELVTLALLAVVVWFLWPMSLGGHQQMVAVNGHSMEPTYNTGDLLIVRPNESPQIGDIIVYHIPDDEPGAGNMVVHRVIARRPDGSIQTQGDNRDTADQFHVEDDDIIGSPVVAIPYGARFILFLGTPVGLALIAGAIATFLLWPEKNRPASIAEDDPNAELWRVPSFEVYMAEAEAWVERELARADPWATRELFEVGPWVGRDIEDADEWVALELAGVMGTAPKEPNIVLTDDLVHTS